MIGHTLLISWNNCLKILRSVAFKTPIAGSTVKYVKMKSVPPIIRGRMPVKGKAVAKRNTIKAAIAEAIYILTEDRVSMLKLNVLDAINNSYSVART